MKCPRAFIPNLAWHSNSAGIYSILAVVYWILVFIVVETLFSICDRQAHNHIYRAMLHRAYNTRDKYLKGL